LLVEDDALLRGAMKMVLEWEGYRVACAANGREALHLLRTSARPHLILLGLAGPSLDGRELRQQQKRDSALAAIPVVIVSEEHAPEGAAAHLRKPFQPEELLQAIRAAQRH
jgi:CheY-like chemotaxis protein